MTSSPQRSTTTANPELSPDYDSAHTDQELSPAYDSGTETEPCPDSDTEDGTGDDSEGDDTDTTGGDDSEEDEPREKLVIPPPDVICPPFWRTTSPNLPSRPGALGKVTDRRHQCDAPRNGPTKDRSGRIQTQRKKNKTKA